MFYVVRQLFHAARAQQMKRPELCIKCGQNEKLRPIRVVAFSLFFQIKLFQSWRHSSETMRVFKFPVVAGKLPFFLSKWTHIHCPWNVHNCPEKPSLHKLIHSNMSQCAVRKDCRKFSPKELLRAGTERNMKNYGIVCQLDMAFTILL